MRRFERDVRVHRAHSERFQIVPVDQRVDGAYRVTGDSGSAYHVDIVDRSGERDACSCTDFLTNDLGTCKHLEAVRRAIARVPVLQRAFQALPTRPRAPVLTVRGTGGAALQAMGRWHESVFHRLGIERVERRGIESIVPLTTAANGQLLPGLPERGPRVVHAAPVLVEKLRRAQVVEGRRKAVTSAMAKGKLALDVLAKPLFPYQREGAAHLLRAGRALLADDMGLGKTAQAIAACELLRARGEASRILVVTLASLKHQWAREIENFAGVPAVVVGGNPIARRHALESDAPYKILNYELTWRELRHLKGLDADVVIYDEAQRAKNFRTKTARTIQEIPSRFAFVLTGTPVENRLDDLYSLMQLVDPSVFGPLWNFNLTFHQQTETGKVVGYKNLSELRERIAPVVLRRRKEEVLTQLPALTEQTRHTALTAAQQEMEQGYRQMAGQLMAKAAKRGLTKKEQEILMMYLLKARQACNAGELCDPKRAGSPKLDEFETLITEIASQGTSKVLVFSEWVEMLKLAQRRLDKTGIGNVMLHGGVPTDKRPALLDRFRESDEIRVLLATEAGGTGLNLQVASYVVHLDLPWNPGRLDQRTARAHRMGQTRGVSVIYLCAEEGIERAIEKTLAGKRAIRSAALDGGSSVETLEAPSFTVFLSQMQNLFDELAEEGGGVEVDEDPEPATSDPAEAEGQPRGSKDEDAAKVGAVALRLPRRTGEGYAQGRLALARVVLEAGFPGDAVKAAYEALAGAIGGLLSEAPDSHSALVAAIYRELLQHGRLPAGAHGSLARLHDLTTLESHGVAVDTELASAAVREAGEWIARISRDLMSYVSYSGSVSDLATVARMTVELSALCSGMGWWCRSVEELVAEGELEATDLHGLSLSPDPRCEALNLHVDAEGQLVNHTYYGLLADAERRNAFLEMFRQNQAGLDQLLGKRAGIGEPVAKERGQASDWRVAMVDLSAYADGGFLDAGVHYNWVKTHGGGPAAHVAVCRVLRVVKERHAPSLVVKDDTGYFESGLIEDIERHMGGLDFAKRMFLKSVDRLKRDGVGATDARALVERLNRYLQDAQRTLD